MPSNRHAKKTAAMVATMKAKTGRSVDEWVALVRADGPEDDREWQTWLKRKHGLGHFQARLIASASRAVDAGD